MRCASIRFGGWWLRLVHALVSAALPPQLLIDFNCSLPCRLAIDDMHDYIYKTPAQLAAEAGLTIEVRFHCRGCWPATPALVVHSPRPCSCYCWCCYGCWCRGVPQCKQARHPTALPAHLPSARLLCCCCTHLTTPLFLCSAGAGVPGAAGAAHSTQPRQEHLSRLSRCSQQHADLHRFGLTPIIER